MHKLSRNEMLKDLLISQLQMLRLRLVQNISDIDKYTDEIERRFKEKIKKGMNNGRLFS